MDIVETNSRLVDSLNGVYAKFNAMPILGTEHSEVLKEDNSRMVREEKTIWMVSQALVFLINNPLGRLMALVAIVSIFLRINGFI